MTTAQRAEISARKPYETMDGIVTGQDILAAYDAVAAGTEVFKALQVEGNSNRRADYSLARLKAWGHIRFDKPSRKWLVT